MDGANWTEQVNRKLILGIETEEWVKRSIYRLPTSITNLNKKAYIPREVSFGPFHHGEDHLLLPMKERKERALLYFLKRSNKPLQFLIDSLKEVVGDLKSSYAMLPTEWQDDNKFIQLMILDGCFLLKILQTNQREDYVDHDPIFSHEGMIRMRHRMTRDMLMLENQLPLLVLEKLLAFEESKQDDEHLNKLILDYTSSNTTEEPLGKCLHVLDVYRKNLLRGEQQGGDGRSQGGDEGNVIEPPSRGKCLHVLDVYRKNRLRGEQQGGDERSQGGDEGNVIEPPFRGKCLHVLDECGKNLFRGEHQGGDEGSQDIYKSTIPSATELNLAGIRFSPDKTGSLKDISFKSGTLKLPRIVVDDYTESMFLNLIAYERYHIGTGNQEISSYIYLMDCIIDTEKDVAFLKSEEIVQNFLGSDKDVAKLFNSLAIGVTLDPDSKLDGVLLNVHERQKKLYIACRIKVSSTVESFKHRWAFLSLVAAVCLFALAVTSTVYTVLDYHKNDSPRIPPAVPPPPPPMIPPPPRVISRRLSSYYHL